MALHYIAVSQDLSQKSEAEIKEILVSSAHTIADSAISKQVIMQLIEEAIATRIGKLKLVAVKDLQPIDISLPSSLAEFDGWCYPDGREFNPSFFPELAKVFPADTRGKHHLPDLRHFFKTIATSAQHPLQLVNGKNDVQAHSHAIVASPTAKIKVNDASFMWMTGYESSHTTIGGKYYTGAQIPDESVALHGSSMNTDQHAKLYNMAIKIKAGSQLLDGEVEPAGNTDSETYPTYDCMPVKMFIGYPTTWRVTQ